jgi:hypothetical protein
VVGDDAAAIEATLKDGLITQKHTRPDFERLRMPAKHTATNLHAVAKAARERPPCRAAHHRVELPLTVCEASVQLHQRPRLIAPTHGVSELTLERRIRHNGAAAVHGFNGAVHNVSHGTEPR